MYNAVLFCIHVLYCHMKLAFLLFLCFNTVLYSHTHTHLYIIQRGAGRKVWKKGDKERERKSPKGEKTETDTHTNRQRERETG